MTEQELLACAQAALTKWQSRLHQQHWMIDIQIADTIKVGPDDDAAEGAFDGNYWHQVGVIRVAKSAPAAYRESSSAWPGETDQEIIERIVLHELLHVCEKPLFALAEREFNCYFGKAGGAFALEPARHAWWAARETYINHLARVLIEADRSGGWAA